MASRDGLVALGTILLLMGTLHAQAYLVWKGWLRPTTSRKVGHIGLGVAILLGWTAFSDAGGARWWAAAVPAALALYFLALGLGWIRGERVVSAVSRSGSARECINGPFYYLVPFAIITAVFWRDSPVGIASLMMLVGGDGLGEVVGRSVGSPALAWNRNKSIAGSLGVLFGGWFSAVLALWAFGAVGPLPSPVDYLGPLMWVAVAGAVAESLPVGDLDNLTVPFVSAAVGVLVFT